MAASPLSLVMGNKVGLEKTNRMHMKRLLVQIKRDK